MHNITHFTHADFCPLPAIIYNIPRRIPPKNNFSGFDEMLLSAAVLGTDGAIGSSYNFIGNIANEVFNSVFMDDLVTARTAQTKINTIADMLLDTELIPTIKAVFIEFGIEAGNCRFPMMPNGKPQYDVIHIFYNLFLRSSKK